MTVFLLATAIIALFFLAGLLFSYILFPVCEIIERICYSVVFSVTLSIVSAFIFKITGLDINITLAFFLVLLNLIFVFLIIYKIRNSKQTISTLYNKDIWLIFIFSIIGTFWRYWFKLKTKNYGSAFEYTGIAKNKNIPDLGFYTGMVKDHANYFANSLLKDFFDYFFINFGIIDIFIIVFLYLGFIYLIFSHFRKNKILTYSAIIIFSLGPLEIFYTTTSFLGHSLSYITLFVLFLFFKSKDKNIFWLALFLVIYSSITYYTATMVIIIASVGFIISLIIQEYLFKNNFLYFFKNKKILGFFLFLIICLFYLIILSNMKNFTLKSAQNTDGFKQFSYHFLNEETLEESEENFQMIEEKTVKESILKNQKNTPEKMMLSSPSFYYLNTKYKDPYFFGLSAISWQTLFFILCGTTFILYILSKKDFSEENKNLLLGLIPIVLISFAFVYKNYFTRAMDYVAFFGILNVKIPKKYYKIFLILSLIFIVITCFQITKDRSILKANSYGEIQATSEISNLNLIDGKIFSDQKFINNLILSGYYTVTGTNDNDPLLIGLFYSKNEDLFLESVKNLEQKGIKYIAITERMRKNFIFMLDYHKKNIITEKFFEKNLEKIYDNGDVKIYSTNLNHHENESEN
jgi:hypothetical protein